MNNTCPQCQAIYNVQAKDIGRRIACKKCGARLVVDATGLVYDTAGSATVTPSAAPAPDDDDLGGPSTYTQRRGGGDLLGKLKAIDIPTWLMGAGAFFVILFLFFPLIDQAKIAARNADVQAGDLRERTLDRKLEAKKDRTASEQEQRTKQRDKWINEERPELQADADQARISARKADYWTKYGMMFGFLLLAAAALGFLSPAQPGIRRVVGAIVLCSLLVLVFIYFVFVARTVEPVVDTVRDFGPGPGGFPK